MGVLPGTSLDHRKDPEGKNNDVNFEQEALQKLLKVDGNYSAKNVLVHVTSENVDRVSFPDSLWVAIDII